jgi:hypothetical protein
MPSSFALPILVRPDDSSTLLERVPLTMGSSGAYSEAWLQDLLYKHPKALPIAEIDDGFSGMVPVCVEMATPAGPVDIVYVTPSGRPAIVEAKLWRNPEARRVVIGQILDYAKELSRWNFETFDAAVRQARRKDDGASPKGLIELVGLDPSSPDAARFTDAVSQNLRRGDFLLLIVGDGIREGVGAITEFLEGHASLHFTFGLVEMAIHSVPDGGRLIQPRVLAQSTIIKRIVVDLRHESMRLDEAAVEGDEAATNPELDASHEKFRAFWTAFLQKLRLDDQSQPLKPPAQAQNQYFAMPRGSDAYVSAYLAQSANRAGVYLTFYPGAVGDRIYAALREQRQEIEDALGVPTEWQSDGKKHWVFARQNYPGSLLGDHAEELRSLLADRVNRFVTVFRPRIKSLVESGQS